MKTLITILAFTILAMLLGKLSSRKSAGWYIIIILVTVVQVSVALYLMFTMESPTS